MCKYMSFVVTPDGVLWELTTNSHEDLIRRYGLSDIDLNKRRFVRVENVPTNTGWIYKVDEEGTLPSWYTKNEDTHKARVLSASQARLRGLRTHCATREDLSGADLSGANLSRADLFRADLSGADLSRANLSGANLSDILRDNATIL